MSKQITDLNSELLKLVGSEEPRRKHDSRFQHWAKIVTGIDTSKSNGYSFLGEFVRSGTIEFEVRPRLFLVKTINGSQKYQTEHYSAVKMDIDGQLHLTDIYTDGKTNGWALRIRDQIKTVLHSLSDQPAPNPLAGFSDEELLNEIARRGLNENA